MRINIGKIYLLISGDEKEITDIDNNLITIENKEGLRGIVIDAELTFEEHTYLQSKRKVKKSESEGQKE